MTKSKKETVHIHNHIIRDTVTFICCPSSTIASACGVGKSTLWELMNCPTKRFRIETVEKVCKGLALNIDDVIKKEERKAISKPKGLRIEVGKKIYRCR